MNCSGYSCRFLTNDYFFRLFRCQMFANLQACLDADNPLWNWWIDIGYWRGYWSMRPIICTEFTKSKFTACFMEIVCRRRNIGVMGMHKNWIMKEWDVLWMAHRKTYYYGLCIMRESCLGFLIQIWFLIDHMVGESSFCSCQEHIVMGRLAVSLSISLCFRFIFRSSLLTFWKDFTFFFHIVKCVWSNLQTTDK